VASACALGGRGHEAYQRVPHGFGDGVGGRAVEGHGVDDGADDDGAAHELADGLTNVLVISAESVYPTDHKHVASVGRADFRQLRRGNTAPKITRSVHYWTDSLSPVC
jgi:hypothetical protein